MRVLLLLVAVSAVVAPVISMTGLSPALHAADVTHKRALIVAIGNYPKSTGWSAISSANDIELVRAGLLAQNFDAISVLPERQSTREGILKAIEDNLLTPAGKGDVVLFHYSGHGQQLTDDNGDEPDGYDEAIVPIDAPATPAGGYRGAKHIRDDEIAAQLRRLREKVGPTGNVVAIFDSCFSGAITRGSLAVRGGPPLGQPAPIPQTPREAKATGLFELGTPRGAKSPPNSELAPYVVISAARFDELDYEMRSPSGKPVGPLSYAMSTSLLKMVEGSTYRSLFATIQNEMQKRVRNEPQIEGDVDTVVFNGRGIPQRPFIAIASIIDGRNLSLAGGTLLGLERGTTVEIHRADASSPSDGTRLATGKITNSTPTTARVVLTAPVGAAVLKGGRAFVTRYTFGDLRLRTQLAIATVAATNDVRTALGDVAAIELVTERPDLIVREGPDSRMLAIIDADTGTAIGAPIALHANRNQIAMKFEDIARNRYLRRLTLSPPGLKAGIEIVPVTLTACTDSKRPTEDSCTVRPLDIKAFVTKGHGLSFPIGTYFKFRIAPAMRASFIAVIDLSPDGSIGVLVPNNPTRKETTAPGKSVLAQGLWQFAEPLGQEVFMLVASDEFVDFSPFASTNGTARGRARPETLGAFSPLFDASAIRNRAIPVAPIGAVSTYMLPVTVRPR